MKFISFHHNGSATYGAVREGLVVDLRPEFGSLAADLKSLIAKGLLADAAEFSLSASRTLELEAISFLPVIPNPGKIICVGLNYADHVLETGRVLTEAPALFIRVADSQVAHGEGIVLPSESSHLDYEGEIAIIIGKAGRRIAQADAWAHIAGYACYNDGSVRDWQLATSQWTAGKNFWRTGAFGPWMVTRDEIEDGQIMTLVTRLNGEEMQRSSTDRLIHSIPQQIAHISTFTPLEPGDVIVTGTPGGVGFKRAPPVWMKAGDVVEIEVDAIGVLRNSVVASQ
jgi:2-keto-4-pentenoate hydratase/2-oxohepta-3-ene-1,7-dioic acid hydratase in catechol pathway